MCCGFGSLVGRRRFVMRGGGGDIEHGSVNDRRNNIFNQIIS